MTRSKKRNKVYLKKSYEKKMHLQQDFSMPPRSLSNLFSSSEKKHEV